MAICNVIPPPVESKYSTSEIDTGQEWIDGKVIYRQVIDFGNLPDTTTKNMTISSLSGCSIIKMYGIACNGSYTLPIPSTNGEGKIMNLFFNNVQNILSISTQDNKSGFTAYVIIEYTKSQN